MYVGFDVTEHRITHIHPKYEVLDGLVLLEGSCVQHMLTASTKNPLFGVQFNSAELIDIYQNSTGERLAENYSAVELRSVVAMLAEKGKQRSVSMHTLQKQIDIAMPWLNGSEEDDHQFVYHFGAKKPFVDEPFPLFTSKPLSSEVVQRAVQSAHKRFKEPAETSKASTTESCPQPGTGSKFTGTAKAKIWEVADAMWATAGNPTDRAVVLELRKLMMIALEDEGIRKSTSSSSLGQWMKARLQES